MTEAMDLRSPNDVSSPKLQSQSSQTAKEWTYIEFLDRSLLLNLDEYDIPKRVTFLEAFIQTGFEDVLISSSSSLDQETHNLVCRSFDSICHFMDDNYSILLQTDTNETLIYDRLFGSMLRLIKFRDDEINYKIKTTLKKIFSNIKLDIHNHARNCQIYLRLLNICQNILDELKSDTTSTQGQLPESLQDLLSDKRTALLITIFIQDTVLYSLSTSSTFFQLAPPHIFNHIFKLASQTYFCLKVWTSDTLEMDNELDEFNGYFADICCKTLKFGINRSIWCDLALEWLLLIVNMAIKKSISETLDIKATSLAIDLISLIITDQSGSLPFWPSSQINLIDLEAEKVSNVVVAVKAIQNAFAQYSPNTVCLMLDFENTFLKQKVWGLLETIEQNELSLKPDTSQDVFVHIFRNLPFSHDISTFNKLEKFVRGCFNELSTTNKICLMKRIGLVACSFAGTLNISTLTCETCDSVNTRQATRPIELLKNDFKSLGFQTMFKIITSCSDFSTSVSLVDEFLRAFYRFGSAFDVTGKSGKIDYIKKWIFKSLRSPSRDIRVAASRILSLPSLAPFSSMLVSELDKIAVSEGRQYLKETTVMAYAQLSNPAEDESLCEILVHMIRFLSIKDSVDTSLLIYHTKAIAKYKGLERVESLFSPFWGPVCKTLVDLDMTEGEDRYKVMRKFCRVIGIPYFSQFFEITHPYIIPLFVMKRFTKGISDVADKVIKSDTTNKIGELLKEDISKIIATTLLESSEPFKYVIQNFINFTNLKTVIGGQNDKDRETMIISKYRLEIAFELLKMYDFKHEKNSKKIDQVFDYMQSQILVRRQNDLMIDSISKKFFDENTLAVFTRFSTDIRDVNLQISTFEKKQCLYGLIKLIKCSGYGFAAKALHQACVLLQAALETSNLQEVTICVWKTLLEILPDGELGTMTDLTFSVVIQKWPTFTVGARHRAHEMLGYLMKDRRQAISKIHKVKAIPYMYGLEDYLPDIYASVKSLEHRRPLIESQKSQLAKNGSKKSSVEHPLNYVTNVIVRASNDNVYIVRQTILETLQILKDNKAFIASSRDRPRIFAVYVKNVCFKLLEISNRFSDSETDIPLLCAECLGYLGALDPSEIDMPSEVSSIIVIDNFEDQSESIDFVAYFLEKYLVKAYLSSTDPNSQLFFAYGIQEFLKFCKLYQDTTSGPNEKANQLWKRFPLEIQTAMAPMKTSRYTPTESHELGSVPYPIFKKDIDYMEWLNNFAIDILKNAKGNRNAEIIFKVCRKIIRDPDPSIVNFILPYATLNVILSCDKEYCQQILNELLIVLNADQNDNQNIKRFYSSVFSILDYLNNWSQKRQFYKGKSAKKDSKTKNDTNTKNDSKNLQLVGKVGNFLGAISPDLMARKSYECKSYPRAIMYWEREMDSISDADTDRKEDIYSKFMEIYVNIDDPDSLDGVARSFKTLSIPHKILTLETAGRWDNALECYESMTKSPEWDWNTDTGYNMLRTMKAGGNYEGLLNIIDTINNSQDGIPDHLLEIGIETAWIQPNFGRMKNYLSMVPYDSAINSSFDVNVARALLALNDKSKQEFDSFIEKARYGVAESLASSKVSFLYQCQDHLAKLHGLFDLEFIGSLVFDTAQHLNRDTEHTQISQFLDGRLSLVGTNYTAKSYLLALRRSAIMSTDLYYRKAEEKLTWIYSSRFARKQKLHKLALSASLKSLPKDAREGMSILAYTEYAKLLASDEDYHEAIKTVDIIYKGGLLSYLQDESSNVRDDTLTKNSRDPRTEQHRRFMAKATLLQTNWLDTSGEGKSSAILDRYYQIAAISPNWEKSHYFVGKYYYRIYESQLSEQKINQRPSFVNGDYIRYIVENYARALPFGFKYIYETLPKLLQLWLDFADNKQVKDKQIPKNNSKRKHNLEAINDFLRKELVVVPAYVLYTGITQMLSRLNVAESSTYSVLCVLLSTIFREYPRQALWFFLTKPPNNERIQKLLDSFKTSESVPDSNLQDTTYEELVSQGKSFAKSLTALAAHKVDSREVNIAEAGFNMKSVPCGLVVPVQKCMRAALPTISSAMKNHVAFQNRDICTISQIQSRAVVMSSMQKPKRVFIRGSNGENYMILCKYNDDVRKDTWLMDIMRAIDSVFHKDREFVKRRLRINTYFVIPLLGMSGLIEWIPGMTSLRALLTSEYQNQGRPPVNTGAYCKKYAKDRLKLLHELQKLYPPVLRNWFLEAFPDPSAWLSYRSLFSKTVAVMSIVGFIFGLGDRHYDNILLDKTNGSIMHVDFDCLFDKGTELAEPEIVPFRLTPNIINGFGVFGYEGIFRCTCEVTMELMRSHGDMLLTLLGVFSNDAIDDWSRAKKKSKHMDESYGRIKASYMSAHSPEEALMTVRNKLRGIIQDEVMPMKVPGQISSLIAEATDEQRLCRMYIGWAPYY